MDIQIDAHQIELSAAQRESIAQQIEHLGHFAAELENESVRAHINVSLLHGKSRNGHVVFEANIFVPGFTIRAEVHAPTVEESLDIAVEKLKKQITKYKDKQDVNIVKRKHLKDIKAMGEAEAAHQMQLLGHDFFVYQDVETGLKTLVYKRKNDEHYGVISME